MTEPTGGEELEQNGVREAVLSEKRGFSIVWLVPAVAAVIGAWLAYTAISGRGPLVHISFENASGLEAGKTKVKYKDVVIGTVESIVLSEDVGEVDVTARLVTGLGRFLTDQTRFWVVRARVSAGQVSGLGTLLSGAYIGVDLSDEGARTRKWVGLERPPPYTSDEEGTIFQLEGRDLGSLEIGSPVYFRWIKVGRVVDYKLDATGDHVSVEVFVASPHDKRVRANTHFWNASGIDFSMSPEGFELDSVSLTSMLIGGISFETPLSAIESTNVPEGHVFRLYRNKRATELPVITFKYAILMYFEQSAAGLVAGSPVSFRGIQIGEVRSIDLVFDEDDMAPRIPVVADIQPERLQLAMSSPEEIRARWDVMVKQGLRAQLATHNMITGQLAVSLDFHPHAPPDEIDWDSPIPVLPTVPGGLAQLTAGLGDLMAKLQDVPIDEIGDNLAASLASLEKVLEGVETATPALVATLQNAESALNNVDGLVAPDSEANVELRRALRELAEAARALRLLAEQLEQNPESLIRGKK